MKFFVEEIHYYRNSEYYKNSLPLISEIIESLNHLDLNIEFTERTRETFGIKSDILNKELRESLYENFHDKLLLVESQNNSFPMPKELNILKQELSSVPDFIFLSDDITLSFLLMIMKRQALECTETFTDYLLHDYFTSLSEIQKITSPDTLTQINQFRDTLLKLSTIAPTDDFIELKSTLTFFSQIYESVSILKHNRKKLIGSSSNTLRGKALKKLIRTLDEINDHIQYRTNTDGQIIIKNQLTIIGEIQFANWAVAKNDIDKIQRIHNYLHIDTIIYITASESLSNRISDGTVGFKKFVSSIESNPYLNIPFIVIGIGHQLEEN